MRKLVSLLAIAVLALVVASPAQAQTYDPEPYNSVDYAIDAVGLPPIFHDIAWRESGDNPLATNGYTCGPFQFLASSAWGMQYVPTSSRYGNGYGYTCAELTDPYTAAVAAKELYDYAYLSPWVLTAY